MVPEKHVLDGASAAAVLVFQTLYGVDASTMLGPGSSVIRSQVVDVPFAPQNDQMEFLRLLIEFERALDRRLQSRGVDVESRGRSVRDKWSEYSKLVEAPISTPQLSVEVLG